MADMHSKSAFAGSETLLDPGMFDQMRLAWRLFRDPRTGWMKNAIPVLAALYFFSPIDLVPDMFLGLGQVDDVGILVGMLILMVQLLPKIAPSWLVDEHLQGMGKQGPPPADRPRSDPSPVGGKIVDATYRVRN